jgi:hypothetical protein
MSDKPAYGSSRITGGSVDGRANLKPWKPGVSGNPRGRPKVAEEVRSLARAHGQRALERLVELIDDPDPRVAFMASREVLDRAYGKPAPPTDVDDQDNKLTVVVKRFEYDAGAAVLAAPPRANEG